MDEKIRLKAIEEYCEEYAKRIVTPYFLKKEKITGPEILNLCEIRQVNLFVIRELMHAWKEENSKLRSPYFDYSSKEVAEALNAFQNTLSNHISIRKDHFHLLLKKAAAQCLFVILAPYDFYAELLDRHGKSNIATADLRADIKYLKVNQAPLERLVQKLEEKKATAIGGNEAFALLDAILEEVNFTPEDIDQYVAQFSKIAPLDLGKLFDPGDELTEPETATKKEEPSVSEPEPEEAPNTIGVASSPSTVKKISDPKSVLNQLQRIATIKENLTINQKFMFTKILFNGDFEIFSQAVDRLDSLDNLQQAMQYIEANFAEWDKESDEYLEFVDMLEKRYS